MEMYLSREEATELSALLTSAVSDLSPEIADTDNARYRMMLRERRERLQSIQSKIDLSEFA